MSAEEEEITRCVCGEQEPADESGLYIQCEECSVWQHGFCVGIVEDVPDKYWCEKCKPELHNLYTDEEGRKRSHYLPVQGQEAGKEEVAERATPSETDLKVENANLPEEDSTNVSEQIQSTEHPAVPAETVQNQPEESSETTAAHLNHTPDTEKTTEQDADAKSDTSDSALSADALSMGRRTSRSSREEQQYQRMLEQAIKESQRDAPGDGEEGPKQELPSANLPLKNQASARGEDEAEPEDAVLSESATESQVQKDTVDTDGKRSSSEEDAGSISASGKKRQRAVRKPQRAVKKPHKTNSRRNLTDRRSRGNSRAKDKTTEVSTFTAVKPRLPSQRTTINEMRRRTSAIMEFISRTQWDLENDQKERDDLVRFVENDDFVKKIDTIFSQNKDALEVMNNLTQKLLNWEKQYAGDR